MNKLKSQKNFKSVMAVFGAIVILGAMDSANLVLSKIMQVFPDVPGSTVRLISTLPSVTTMIITLIIGSLIGKKIGYRTVCIAGLGLVVLGGAGPVLFHSSMTVLLLQRAVYGVGLGLLGCRNGYLMLLCEGEMRENVISVAQTIQSVSSIVLQLICGWLGDIYWTYAFLPFAVGIIPLVLFFFVLKEPDEAQEVPGAQEADQAQKRSGTSKASAWSWVYCVLTFVFGLAGLIWITGMSAMLAERGAESAVTVSFAFVAIQLGSVLAGILFNYVNKFSPKYTVSLAAALGALGSIVIVFASSLVLVMLAEFLAGVGYVLAVIMCNTYSGMSTSRETVTSVTTRVMAVQAVATFCTGFYIEICGKMMPFAPTFTSAAFIMSAILQIIIFVVSLIIDLGPRQIKSV